MLGRRGFFKSLAGLFVVASSDPVRALSISGPAQVVQTLTEPHAPEILIEPELIVRPKFDIRRGMTALNLYMLYKLRQELGDYPLESLYEHGTKLGTDQFNNQPGVDLRLDNNVFMLTDDDEIEKHFVDQVVRMMANEIRMQRAVQFAKPELPKTVDAACETHDDQVSLRALRAYDIHWDQYVMRFDTLFRSRDGA